MENMALLWEGYGIFSDLLILFRFTDLSYPDKFVERLEDIRRKLLERSYHPKIVQEAFDRVKANIKIPSTSKGRKEVL